MLIGTEAPAWAPKDGDWIRLLPGDDGYPEPMEVKIFLCDKLEGYDDDTVRIMFVDKQRAMSRGWGQGVGALMIKKSQFEFMPAPKLVDPKTLPACESCLGRGEVNGKTGLTLAKNQSYCSVSLCCSCQQSGIDVLAWSDQMTQIEPEILNLPERKTMMEARDICASTSERVYAGMGFLKNINVALSWDIIYLWIDVCFVCDGVDEMNIYASNQRFEKIKDNERYLYELGIPYPLRSKKPMEIPHIVKLWGNQLLMSLEPPKNESAVPNPNYDAQAKMAHQVTYELAKMTRRFIMALFVNQGKKVVIVNYREQPYMHNGNPDLVIDGTEPLQEAYRRYDNVKKIFKQSFVKLHQKLNDMELEKKEIVPP